MENTGSSVDINELIRSDNTTIEDLNIVLKHISVLAEKERKEDRNQLILSWVFITISIILFYLSINTSASFYFLSVPLSIITFLYVWVVVPKTYSNASVIKRWFFIESNYSNLDEYVKGYKKEEMTTPIFSHSYKESRLRVRIEELKRIN